MTCLHVQSNCTNSAVRVLIQLVRHFLSGDVPRIRRVQRVTGDETTVNRLTRVKFVVKYVSLK